MKLIWLVRLLCCGNYKTTTRTATWSRPAARIRTVQSSICNPQCQRLLAEGLTGVAFEVAHGGQFVTTRFRVSELIHELEEQLLPLLQQRGAVLEIRQQHLEAELQGNQDALLGALANLCVNALQACSDKPRIEISITLGKFEQAQGGTLLLDEFSPRAKIQG